ncbi:hypothetical protein [Loigolactobacillus backii]|uniref:Uncharacterized protein n=1 Tax=Loigolactobacillus backii TaxID=375175 RepID=A0A192H1H9_9LACO|nr:hypothetical protein [Loigolactobacillus backii]ANK59251.1 hypothetical protein AYR52_02560 [Loigolactobacillus backii]ANK62664.1 hypothetical protein AYR53_07685 [Loigolactobacillus backii]ANK64242.1 hypothetical protein AYR54_02555 [Loigolactobacillus backii]ANK67364.1 hypothetical protein AYR55_06485 [Loigolactobacillus backii]ANK70328.1 hypothetical protein AYR56_09320 [Loigolactobacillus backii]
MRISLNQLADLREIIQKDDQTQAATLLFFISNKKLNQPTTLGFGATADTSKVSEQQYMIEYRSKYLRATLQGQTSLKNFTSSRKSLLALRDFEFSQTFTLQQALNSNEGDLVLLDDATKQEL